MKIVYTKHAREKFSDLMIFGIKVTKRQIRNALEQSRYQSTDNGNRISAGDFDETHNLRIVYRVEKDAIMVITFYIHRKGRYGEH